AGLQGDGVDAALFIGQLHAVAHAERAAAGVGSVRGGGGLGLLGSLAHGVVLHWLVLGSVGGYFLRPVTALTMSAWCSRPTTTPRWEITAYSAVGTLAR